MSQANYITLNGFVTAEPQLRFTNTSQTPVTTIRVGSAPRYLDRATGEWRDGDTSYFDVTCWRRLAENVAGSLRKGDMITVHGKFRSRSYVDGNGRTWTKLQVVADTVGHDLSYGWARFNRGVHVPPKVTQDLANGEAIRHGLAPDDVDLPEDLDEFGISPVGEERSDGGPFPGTGGPFPGTGGPFPGTGGPFPGRDPASRGELDGAPGPEGESDSEAEVEAEVESAGEADSDRELAVSGAAAGTETAPF